VKAGPPPLPGYESFVHSGGGYSRAVYRGGEGPPVIVIHELAGISPMLVAFADRVRARGFSAYLPVLIPRRSGPTGVLRAAIQVCVSAEFVKLARGRTSPIVSWLRSLAEQLHEETGGRVGVVGMCLTGGFALAMAVDEHVVGPVVAHPALPFGFGSDRQRDLGLDPAHLAALKDRADLRIFGARFSRDAVAPTRRFDRIEEEFEDRFTRVEVASGERSPWGFKRGEHSVLCNVALQPSRPDGPGRAELERVVDEVLDFVEAQVRGSVPDR
jgi:dienelactone hydrolase